MDFMMPCEPLEEPPWGFLKKKMFVLDMFLKVSMVVYLFWKFKISINYAYK